MLVIPLYVFCICNCVLEFDEEILLLQHEEIEAREFEALHDSFEKHEFGELEEFSLPDYLGMFVSHVILLLHCLYFTNCKVLYCILRGLSFYAAGLQ
jgi:hypothetical protein